MSVESLKKPNPSKVIAIYKSLGLKTEEIIFVGDSGIDMQTATNASQYAYGERVLGISTKRRIDCRRSKTCIKQSFKFNSSFTAPRLEYINVTISFVPPKDSTNDKLRLSIGI